MPFHNLKTFEKKIILNIIYPGKICGELGIAGLQEREEMEDPIVCVIEVKKMQAMPSLIIKILKRLGARL